MVKKKKSSKKVKGDPGTSTTNSTWEVESTTSQSTNYSTTVTDTEGLTDDDGGDNPDGKSSLEKLDERTDLEKELFDLVGDGDRQAVKNFIAANQPKIDVGHRDIDGDDVLCYAVRLGDKKMVKLVLEIDPGQVNIHNGLLSAIKDGKMGVFLTLLNFEDTRQGGGFYATTKKLLQASTEKKNKKQLKGRSIASLANELDQKKYGHDITPLMQAATSGHYEIMQVLYDRGERLPQLHLPSCSCRECKGATREVEKSLKRIELLKAMAKPEYMIFMASQDGSFDPVLECFQLSGTVGQCANEEPEFIEEYSEILEQLDNLPADLLCLCRTTEEMKIMLAQKEGYIGPPNDPYPRLGLAIELARKNFVVQPSVEFLVHDAYVGHPWPTKNTQEFVVKIVFVLLTMVLFPFFQIILWLGMFCCTELPLIQYLLDPVIRSWSKFASQIMFMLLLLIMNSQERAGGEIEPATIYIRWVIVVYVISHFFAFLRRSLNNRNDVLKHGWTKLDFITQILFWSSFVIWIYLFERKSSMHFEDVILRQQLDPKDPLLIGDMLFAFASTFGSLRIMRWLVLSSFVGPIQTAIARMWKKGLIVLVFLAFATVTFVCTLNILYRPFIDTKGVDEDGAVKEQDKDMTEFTKMFQAFMGFGSLDAKKQILITPQVSYTNGEGTIKTVQNPPVITQYFVYGLGMFHSAVVMTFLQPAVIGIFSGKGDDTVKAKDTEWHYLRIQEWLYNIHDTYLTPPFNLLPTGSCLVDTVSTMKTFSRGRNGGANRDVESLEDNAHEEARRQYPFLLRKLFIRYFQQSQVKKEDSEKPSKGDVNGVQQAVKEVKELSRELLGISEGGGGSRRGS